MVEHGHGAGRERRVVQALFFSNPDGYPPVINSARLLAQGGFLVRLLGVGESRGVLYPPDVEVHRLQLGAGSSVSRYLAFLWAALRLGRRPADLYIGHDMHGFLAARLLAAYHRRPVAYHCHDFVRRDGMQWSGGRIVSEFEYRFARTANLLIVPDVERGEVMARELQLAREPIVVPNAPLAWTQGSDHELENRTQSCCGMDFARVVFRQGVVGPGHAIETTIRSIPLWVGKNWGFVVMGVCDPDYADSLIALAGSLGVRDQFCILPAVGYDEVQRYTAGADVGHGLYEPVHINNVYITTASNKIMEYLAAGLPILVSDRPGLRALVDQYKCGLTADESSPQSIASAVNALLEDPERARRLGAAGARAFEQELNYERQFAPVLEEFQRLTDASRGART